MQTLREQKNDLRRRAHAPCADDLGLHLAVAAGAWVLMCTAFNFRAALMCSLGICLVLYTHTLTANTTRAAADTAPHTQPASLRFKRLLYNENERSGSLQTVHAIEQDQNGFMWLGGEHGLARFDGHTLKRYQHNPEDTHSLASNAVLDIAIDHDGVLWLATSAGLSRYNPKTDNFINSKYQGPYQHTLIAQSLNSLTVTADNALLMGGSEGFAILQPSRTQLTLYSPSQPAPYTLPTTSIYTTYSDSDGTYWLGSTSAGLLKLSHASGQPQFTQFSHAADSTRGPAHNHITSIMRDHQGFLWLSTLGGGVSRFDESRNIFYHYTYDAQNPRSIGGDTVWNIMQDKQHNIWLAVDHGGLNRYNPQTNDFTRFTHNPYSNSSLINDSVRSIYQDRIGDLWVGTYPVGINLLDVSAQNFEHIMHTTGDPNSLSDSAILSIKQSQYGHLWIGTEGGLNAFNPNTLISQQYLAQPGTPNALQFNAVLDTAERTNGDLWVGTWSGGLHKLKAKTRHFTHYMPDGTAPIKMAANAPNTQPITGNSINSAYIWSLVIDGDYLWIGTETGGLNQYHFSTQKFRYFLPNTPANEHQVSHPHVKSIIKDHAGFIWLGTLGGLDKLNPKTGNIEHFYHQPTNQNSIIHDRIASLFEDSQHNIWLGTQGDGMTIIDKTRQKFTHITTEQGLPSGHVVSITEDAQGNIWVLTDSGIACIHPDKTITTIQKSHGLSSNNFKRNTAFFDHKATLYAGATNGITRFKPQYLLQHQADIIDQPQQALITQLKIANEVVTEGHINSPLSRSISTTTHLKLNHQQNIIELNFSAFNFVSPNLIHYRYRLNGFDKSWRETHDTPSAIYTNLPSGKYTFELQASNTQMQWPLNSTTLAIHIAPPPWLTPWAYAGYVLLFLGIINLLWRYKSKQLELQKEQTINSQLIKLDKMKDAFLANTSHELRTPLNGIIGLAESLRDELHTQLSAAQHHTFTMIIQSGLRLSHLVNDILDMSKLGKQEILLHKSQIDVYTLAQTSIALVKPLIGHKPLTIINNIAQNLPPAHADSNRLQQVFLNLLSNAIKYSEQGTITLDAKQHSTQQLQISIRDTGVGISAEHRDSIFESFNQVNNEDTREEGTGLGLSITKKLIELHGGTITLNSKVGCGSTFTFTLCAVQHQSDACPTATSLSSSVTATPATPDTSATASITSPTASPTTNEHNRPADHSPTPKDTQITPVSNTMSASQLLKSTAPSYAAETTILCVDDNSVNLMVLTAILKLHNYKTLEASSGPEALALLESNPNIHLIILDVMMPKMTGYQACEIIRQTRPIHKLPIIFLTAKDIDTEIARGFLVGGNDFATKPVQKAILLARIKVLLDMVRSNQ
ncbi:hybrid sensor histidine kinase/response regulator [Marinagarivorans algicola]|uniref:hybrid sensor histidine kinase/response regulator n=1 Tax=Marinagarivorans algicola TaxID=1513270 RepID=UPI003736B027